jgi:hypothetical protein
MLNNTFIYFESDYFQIGVDRKLEAITLQYKRKGLSEELRAAHHKLLEIFKQNPKDKILIDARYVGIVAPDDQKWVGMQIIPQLAALTTNNFLKLAVVTPNYIFTKLAVDTVERLSMETGVCLNRNFDSFANAEQWLIKQ